MAKQTPVEQAIDQQTAARRTLTGGQITLEALRMLKLTLAGIKVSYNPEFKTYGAHRGDLSMGVRLDHMAHTEALWRAKDIERDIEDFSQRFLVKSVGELAEQILRAVVSNGGKCDLMTADLELPRGLDMAARLVDPESGLSLRLVRMYEAQNDQFVTNLDVIFGLRDAAERTTLERLAGTCRRSEVALRGLQVEEKAAQARCVELSKVCDEATTVLLGAHSELAKYLATGVGVVEIPAAKAAA